MEILDQYAIAWKGLKPGVHDFDFEIGDALFEAFENTDIRSAALKAHVRLDRSESMLDLHTSIEGQVTVPCDRCLEDCPLPIRWEGRLIVRFSDEIDEYDGEVMWIPQSADKVELGQYLYESVILAMPYQRVHAEGECNAEMLARFKTLSAEEFAQLEARAEKSERTALGSAEQDKLTALKRAMQQDHEDRQQS